MKKQVIGLFAATMLCSGISFVPSVKAASSALQAKSKWPSPGIERTSQGDYNSNSNYGKSNEGTQETNNGNTLSDQTSSSVEKVIADGMKYKGTPYEFGSNRSTTTTFDCSDFVRWIFHETLGILLPTDSRLQGTYVKDKGTTETDWHNLKRGDLMFFMEYNGSSAADYRGINKKTERITHVGIYLGDGNILHTYSTASGGVHVEDFTNTTWEYRFLFGGSVMPRE